jgi:hypothetical protein
MALQEEDDSTSFTRIQSNICHKRKMVLPSRLGARSFDGVNAEQSPE